MLRCIYVYMSQIMDNEGVNNVNNTSTVIECGGKVQLSHHCLVTLILDIIALCDINKMSL